MRNGGVVLCVGVLLLVVPALGVPPVWKQWLAWVGGVALVVSGYLQIRHAMQAHVDLGDGERETDTFVETTGSLFTDK